MSELYNRIADLISRISLPNTNETALDRRLVEGISVREYNVRILMRYDTHITREQFARYCDDVAQLCNEHLKPHQVFVVMHEPQETNNAPKSIFGNAPIFMVGSGKGGVGKSTVAFALAQSFVRNKKRVAFIDADIYGPSLPTFIRDIDPQIQFPLPSFEPLSLQDGYFVGSSLGFYMSAETAPIWRGPMLKKALDQLIFQHKWPVCDVVIIDLPPGTGDVILSLHQALPMASFLLVTTPHPLAIADAERTCHMLRKLNIKMGGIVNNMVAQDAMSVGWADIHLVQKLATQNQTTILKEIPFLRSPLNEHNQWDHLFSKLKIS